MNIHCFLKGHSFIKEPIFENENKVVYFCTRCGKTTHTHIWKKTETIRIFEEGDTSKVPIELRDVYTCSICGITKKEKR